MFYQNLSRREFLKGAAVSIAAWNLLPLAHIAEATPVSKDKTLSLQDRRTFSCIRIVHGPIKFQCFAGICKEM